jgi:hypothetical protein
LKGILVGNGATDFYQDVWPAFPATILNYNIIKKDLYDAYEDAGCKYYFNDVIKVDNPPECEDIVE